MFKWITKTKMERGWVNRGGSRTLNFLGGLGLHFDIFLKHFPDVFQCFALVHSNLNYRTVSCGCLVFTYDRLAHSIFWRDQSRGGVLYPYIFYCNAHMFVCLFVCVNVLRDI